MSFAPKSGCPMCGIVATASHAPSNTPCSPTFPAGSTQPEVLWRDDNLTAYREKANPVSSKGHIIIAFNLHVPSVYSLSSSDLPLLVNVRNLARRLLSNFQPPLSPSFPPSTPMSAFTTSTPLQAGDQQFRIGFITPPFRDNKIPVTDHLHAHAFIAPADLMGWWRGVAYSPLSWYAIEDLIAEIRESVSNNRVKSGYTNRLSAPIDMVPDAGARTGAADGTELTEHSLALPDLEAGDPQTPVSLSPPNQLSSIQV